MNHIGTEVLKTPRLILRRFTLDDVQAMFTNWAGDPEVTRFLTWPTHGSAQISQAVTKSWVEGYQRPDFYQWAIVFEGQPVGSISAVRICEITETVEVGYCIGKNWWHRGITTEAMRAVIGFFFEQVGAKRIEARHDANNPRSGDVMKSCGMTFEGTLRQAGWNNQGVCDLCCYGLVGSDWESGKMPFHKLVRDKIPAIMRAAGEKPNIRILEDGEYWEQLVQKLDEEVSEFHRDRNLEELADILEVVYALAENMGHTKDALMDALREKHETRGGFGERIYLISKES